MFSVIRLKITFEFRYIIFFSLRMERFTKFSFTNVSFATNSPNFTAAKVSLQIEGDNLYIIIYTLSNKNKNQDMRAVKLLDIYIV